MRSDFLMPSAAAQRLYQTVSALPVVDYHNHLSQEDVRQNRRFFDLYELWIAPDPYKHRAMRMLGVPEEKITGNASNEEKFSAWWESLPRLIGNPLYHWSVMELEVLFGETVLPDGKDATGFLARGNALLKEKEVTVNSLMASFGVEKACPCASFADSVSFYDKDGVFVPSLRGDDACRPTAELLAALERETGGKIESFADYLTALSKRVADFSAVGCRFADHALDHGFFYFDSDENSEEYFSRALSGKAGEEEKARLFCAVLTFLAEEYAKAGMTLQLHVGALRSTSTRLRRLAGPAGGYAGIGNSVDIASVSRFLDAVERGGALPKTILFPLNPSDNAMISTLSGSFSADGRRGLVTQGPAWWWCDHKKGIEDMLANAEVFGLLYDFVGMTTDSRSFLSFVRHDYFRRILCEHLGEKMEKGEIFSSEEDVLNLAKAICYYNAKECF